jgi:outer membrane lipoprotein SlyB
MNRPAHRPASTPRRRVGTPVIGLAALAAAGVLAACGPEDDTVVAATSIAPVTLEAGSSASTAFAATEVPAAHVLTVADRVDRVAPRAVYGQISAIEPITESKPNNRAGAVVGGVLGAVVGNQVGSGDGRAAATVLGGVGGAVIGNKVQKHRNEQVTGYRVHIQLDSGGMRTFERSDLGNLDVGDRVRIDGDRLRELG